MYHTSWTPRISEFRKYNRSDYDHFAVAVLKDGDTWDMYFFLRHEGNIIFCEVTDEKLNLGVQLGVEVPCVYKSYGRWIYVKELALSVAE